MNRALASLGFPPHPNKAYRYFVGEGIGELARRALPENRRGVDDVKACLSAISREYGGSLLVKTQPYPGVPELLAELVKRNIRLRRSLQQASRAHDAFRGALFPGVPFGAVLGERTGIPTKPDPAIALEAAAALGVAPAQCAYVGDSGVDMKTAVAAGMFPVGALWGFRDKDELMANGAKALLKHPMDLLEVIDKRFEGMAGILGTDGDMLKSLMEDKKREREL